ncbi:MAG: hypothetical protein AB1742_07830 [bacterium]
MKYETWRLRNARGFVAAVVLAFAAAGGAPGAGEHPSEHPSEDAVKRAEKPSLTAKDIAKAIKSYVEKDSKIKGGLFVVYDAGDRKPLALTLKKVHEERLSRVSGDTYFACADFVTPDGVVYDLDVFMQKGGHGIEATEVRVHKKEGKERYTWVEEKGVWKRKDVEAKKKGTGD